MKKFRNLLEGLVDRKQPEQVVESDKNWSDSLKKIARERQLKSLSKKDRETLEKIAAMMAKANESAELNEMTQRFIFDTLKSATRAEKMAARFDLDVDSGVGKDSDGKLFYVAVTGEYKDIIKWMKLLDTFSEGTIAEVSARQDAMRAIKRDKDFQQVKDVDIKATADDMKLAKKNPIVQLRKILDYKGGTMEFMNKKTLRLKADDADALLRGFDALQKVQDKERYQALISKDPDSLKKILQIVKR